MQSRITSSTPWCRLHALNAIILVALLWFAAGPRVSTEDLATSMFHCNGSLSVVHSSDNLSDFLSNEHQPTGAGFTNSWSATPDSKLWAPLSANFTDRDASTLGVVETS